MGNLRTIFWRFLSLELLFRVVVCCKWNRFRESISMILARFPRVLIICSQGCEMSLRRADSEVTKLEVIALNTVRS